MNVPKNIYQYADTSIAPVEEIEFHLNNTRVRRYYWCDIVTWFTAHSRHLVIRRVRDTRGPYYIMSFDPIITRERKGKLICNVPTLRAGLAYIRMASINEERNDFL